MYLSEQGRLELLEALKKAIPNVEHPELRAMFMLMVALLCDYQELTAARRMDAEGYLNHLRSIEGSLRKLAKSKEGVVEPETRVWQ